MTVSTMGNDRRYSLVLVCPRKNGENASTITSDEVSSGTPKVRPASSRNRLRQVFSILIDNTLRYAADGGQLDVDAFISNDCVTTEFSDRGCGIDPKDLARVFDRFRRAESSRACHSGGSGLGLSIASAICIAHGGSITAINRDGGGATVRVSLPIRAAVPRPLNGSAG